MPDAQALSHIAYRTIDGRSYVLVSHAVINMRGMADEALEQAALLASKWGDRPITALPEAIRLLKCDVDLEQA